MNPTVTVVVPSYNYAHFLTQGIESLLDQTFTDLEVLVIDNASTDDTPAVLARYASEPRVRVIRHQHNQGRLTSFNEGLTLARGDYVALLDADDFAVRRDAIARQVEVFERQPSVGFVYSAHELVDGQGQRFAVSLPWEHDYVADGLEEFRRLVWSNYVPHSGTLVRRVCNEELGGYADEVPFPSDWDRWLRIATRYDVGYIADPLYAYRIHGSNDSHAKVRPDQAIDQLLRTLDRNFAALPSPEADGLLALRGPARKSALFQTLWLDLAYGRTRRAWQSLSAMLSRSPRLLLDRTFYATGARVVELTLFGRERYRRIHGGLG